MIKSKVLMKKKNNNRGNNNEGKLMDEKSISEELFFSFFKWKHKRGPNEFNDLRQRSKRGQQELRSN